MPPRPGAEAAGIAATVSSMAASSYDGELEVIVVDDGSADATAAIVRRLGLPGVRVISQPNAGKPGALYRQLLYLVTVQSMITALPGTRQRWQPIRRAGIFSAQRPSAQQPGSAGP